MIITGKKFSKPTMSRVKNGDVVFADKDRIENRQRLDLLLVEKFPQYNRSTIQNFIKSGYVTVNGKIVVKPNFSVLLSTRQDDIITHLSPEITCNIPERHTPANLDHLRIYEDDNVIVLNKPAGLLSMAKGEYSAESTLEDYGLLVHRLDRDTSGVVILAKNEATRTMLRRQFQERKAHKTYLTLVTGKPKNDQALIDLPIGRNLKRPTTFVVDPNGRSAQTHYRILWSNDQISLLELHPITGRTHQLRVHLNYIGCPILGDRIYGEHNAPRLMLHAYSLEITIPGTDGGARETFSAPIPQEFLGVTRLSSADFNRILEK